MDAPLPLPSADPLTPAVVAPPGAAPDALADGMAAGSFAALLELARVTLDPADAAPEAAADRSSVDDGSSTETTSADAAPTSSALDGLLFLANITLPAPSASAGGRTAPPADARALDPSPSMDTAATLAEGLAATAAARAGNGPPASEPVEAPRFDARVALAATTAADRLAARATAEGERAGVTPRVAHASDTESLSRIAAAASTRDPTLPAMAPAAAAPSGEPATLLATHAHAAPRPDPVAVTIDTPVHDAHWRHEAAEKIVSLVTRGAERAELRLSPAELGPVEVRIDLRGGEASFAIVAVQPATRDALEQALPLLRDLLAQQGMTLGEATVRDGRADGEAKRDHEWPGEASAGADANDAPVATSARRIPGVARLVDVFA